MQETQIEGLTTTIERLGVVAAPSSRYQVEGVLNPAMYHDRDGNLVMMVRSVALGNQSRLELFRQIWRGGKPLKEGSREAGFKRVGFALTPRAGYERRRDLETKGSFESVGGEGCEDPRVTFLPVLDCYLLCYTAFGPQGPRIALAFSKDGYKWRRLGLVAVPDQLGLAKDDKDAAFFPEPVVSPAGVLSLALLHRPMPNVAVENNFDAVLATFKMPAEKRQCMRIAYVPLEPVLKDLRALLQVAESHLVLAPTLPWGQYKVGGGTAPLRLKQGWLQIFHGVDQKQVSSGTYQSCYSAGLLIHDLENPLRLLHVSREPLFKPETKDELEGTVNNVVFPTGIVDRADLGESVFDIYYGMADRLIGRCRLSISFST